MAIQIVNSDDELARLVGKLSRTVVFLTLFSLIMVFIFVVAGYQHLSDDSVDVVLRVLSICTACNAVLCVMLFVLGIIASLHTAIRQKRIRHIKPIFLSVISFILSVSLLCIAMTITFASEGIGG